MMQPGENWVGRSLLRKEDPPLLSGRAKFIDDILPLPGILHAAILRSPHAHAKITSIDISKAAMLSGVVSILTGVDVADMSRPFGNVLREAPRGYCCAIDRVRYVGEPLAVVVASDRYIAEDALELIEVTYDPLPVVASIDAALDPGGCSLNDGFVDNVVHRKSFLYGNPDARFDEAAHIVEVTTDHPRINSTPMETYGVIAHYEEMPERYTAWSNFQGPFILQPVVAAALKVPTVRLRLISPPASGGSFGIKQGLFPYIALVALASRKAKAPVKWIEDRVEHLVASVASTGRKTRLVGAFDTDGELRAARWYQTENVGAYLRPPEPSTLYRMHGSLNGPYRVRDISVENKVVLTNQVPAGLNRGYGGPQFVLPLERLMDAAATSLGLDPTEIRRRNFIDVDSFPYTCPSGQIIDSGDYEAALDQAMRQVDYDGIRTRREAALKEGRLFGVGIATSIETSVSGMSYVNLGLSLDERAKAPPKSGAAATVTISVDPGGSVSVWTGSTPNGQGHATVISQVVADELGLHPENIHVVTEIDTGRDPWSITSGNYSNRFAGVTVSAASMAAHRLAGKLRVIAGEEMCVPPEQIDLVDGMAVARAGANKPIPIGRLGGGSHWNTNGLPPDIGGSLSETFSLSPEGMLGPDEEDRVSTALTCGFMCDIAAVEIDPKTGRVTIVTYGAVHDVGRVLHPKMVEGQAQGGFAHGLGAAVFERLAYDAGGAFLSGTFADYLCPTAPEMPTLTLGLANSASTTTRLGTKGLGDGASMNTPAAMLNAVADALQRPDVSLPLTPSRVWSMHRGLDPDPVLKKQDMHVGTGTPVGALRGEGHALLSADLSSVWTKINDVMSLKAVIPGCQDITETSHDCFTLKVNINIAGIGGAYEGTIRLDDKHDLQSLRLKARGEGALGFGEGEALVKLIAIEPNVTRLTYQYGADVGGRVASVGSRMLNGALGLLLSEFFGSLQETFGGPRRSLLRRMLKRVAIISAAVRRSR